MMPRPSMPPAPASTRFRFGPFLLSPRRRQLLRDGRPVALIPRYLDLLLLLVERRHEAVHRTQILSAVWPDVVVSEGALTQAVRSLRRALGDDDPREPRFIRTVSRHGYQFVSADTTEEPDDGGWPVAPPDPAPAVPAADPFEEHLARLLGSAEEEDRREAAERLHALGTAEALRRLDHRPGHARARALLRDARWDVPEAGPVPILGGPGAFEAALALARLRLARALRLVALRWQSASAGGALAGAFSGFTGGLVLWLGPGSTITWRGPFALALIGAAIGGLGAAGVGAGLAAAEALFRSWRGPSLVALGAAGGGAIGALAHFVAEVLLGALLGRNISHVGGGFEGLVIGAGAGLGYALGTRSPGGGLAAPRGGPRWRAAALTGACCAAAGLALTWSGSLLGGVSLDYLARSLPGSELGLQPLARLLGEPQAGPATGAVLACGEGLMFGFGLAMGLTRRVAPEA